MDGGGREQHHGHGPDPGRSRGERGLFLSWPARALSAAGAAGIAPITPVAGAWFHPVLSALHLLLPLLSDRDDGGDVRCVVHAGLCARGRAAEGRLASARGGRRCRVRVGESHDIPLFSHAGFCLDARLVPTGLAAVRRGSLSRPEAASAVVCAGGGLAVRGVHLVGILLGCDQGPISGRGVFAVGADVRL